MTESERVVLREKIRKVMVDHLATVGPNLTNAQIMGQLKNLWIKLEDSGLLVSGMSFRKFQEVANDQFMMADIRDFFGV